MNTNPLPKNRHILVVDDNPAIHADFRKLLVGEAAGTESLDHAAAELFGPDMLPSKRTPFDLSSAFQGQEALAMVQQAEASAQPFAMAFVDVRMPPGWDGIQTTERLWEAAPDLQVVICTAYSDYSFDQMTDRLGASDRLVILKKPFDAVEVLQLANALTEKWRLSQEVRRRFADLDTLVRDRTQQLRLQSAALESAANSVVITDPQGIILWHNPAFCRLTGYASAEVLGKKTSLLKSGEHDADFYRNLWQTLAGGGVWRGEITNRRKDGSLYTEDMTVTPVRSHEGTITHYVAIKQDTTEHKELEQRLRQSQKMEAIGQLAGGVAHDFNNLLAVIRGNTELALMVAEPFKPETRDCLNQVVAAADRAAGLTRQLLAFGRKQVMQAQPLSLNDVVGNLTKMLRRIIGEDIQLQCSYAPKLPLVRADAGMVEQVLVNLVVNARDAMPQGGQLLIVTETARFETGATPEHPEARAGEFVQLGVVDTGTGIAPEHLPRIFEPFFTTKELGKGTGLGLATVYGIVKQHQGWLEVSSRLGAGSTFKVFLPVHDAPAAIAAKAALETAPPGGSETILLVEDDEPVRSLTRRLLESAGYRVHDAASGRAALERWQPQVGEIDLLLTDIIMPEGLSGRELAEQLRERRPELKVIFMSGYSGDALGQETSYIQRNHCVFVQKPCSAREILTAVRECLDGGGSVKRDA